VGADPVAADRRTILWARAGRLTARAGPVVADIAVSVAIGIAVSVAVDIAVSVAIDIAVSVTISIAVSVAVDIAVSVAVDITVSVAVDITVSVAVDITVAIAVAVAITVSVAIAGRQTRQAAGLVALVALAARGGASGPAVAVSRARHLVAGCHQLGTAAGQEARRQAQCHRCLFHRLFLPL
jgi:hypothetical protein